MMLSTHFQATCFSKKLQNTSCKHFKVEIIIQIGSKNWQSEGERERDREIEREGEKEK